MTLREVLEAAYGYADDAGDDELCIEIAIQLQILPPEPRPEFIRMRRC